MRNVVVILIVLISVVVNIRAQSLKGITLGEEPVKEAYFSSSVGGLEGMLITKAYQNVVFEINFIGDRINNEKLEAFLKAVQTHYRIKFTRSVKKGINYKAIKDDTKYTVNLVEDELSSFYSDSICWHVTFVLERISLKQEQKMKKEFQIMNDF